MLNEQRKKVRYSTNPNGNTWAEDKSGFGRKILEKLGWSSGTGLGKNRDGVATAIRPKGQTGKKGIGLKTDYSLGGDKQLEDYAELLKTLNASYASANSTTATRSSPKGLEEISRTNVFKCKPSKFIRAKDFTKYDEKSVAVILGQTSKTRNDSPTPEQLSGNSATAQNMSSDFGVKTVSSQLSMTDYFLKRKRELEQTTKHSGSKVPRIQPGQCDVSECSEGSPCVSSDKLPIVTTQSESPETITQPPSIPTTSVFSNTNLHMLPGYVNY